MPLKFQDNHFWIDKFAHLAHCKNMDLRRKCVGQHELFFHNLLTQIVKPQAFLEIGAHNGQESLKVHKALPDCHIVALEADPDNHAAFKKGFEKVDAQKVKYLNFAATDQDREISFFKQVERKGKSIGHQLIGQNSVLIRDRDDIKHKEIKVPGLTLDTLTKKEGLRGLSQVWWVDVEGHLYEVLNGAGESLEDVEILYTEVEEEPLWKGQKTVFDIADFLEEKGFYALSRDIQLPRQYNILWAREKYFRMFDVRHMLANYFARLDTLCSNETAAMNEDHFQRG